MIRKIPAVCPSCSGNLEVKSLQCPACSTRVEGNFKLPLLVTLHEDEQEFIIEFVKSSGSLKEMSKHLKLSYPGVRNKLDEIISHIHELQKSYGDGLEK
jgi:hypothetical protein